MKMGFFDWLLGKGWNNPTDDVPAEFVVDPRKFKTVPKWTHAGRPGKDIHCPKCGTSVRVYNFAWSALVCNACATVVEKYEWLMPVTRKKKNK